MSVIPWPALCKHSRKGIFCGLIGQWEGSAQHGLPLAEGQQTGGDCPTRVDSCILFFCSALLSKKPVPPDLCGTIGIALMEHFLAIFVTLKVWSVRDRSDRVLQN